MHTKGITHVLQLQACTRAVYNAAKSGSPCVLESWCALDTATTHSTLARNISRSSNSYTIQINYFYCDHAQHTCAHGMHGGKLAHRKTPRRHRSTHATWLHADTIKHAGAHQRTGCSLAAVCMGTVHAHCTGPNDHHDPKQRASTSALGAAMSLRTGLGVFVLGFTARQLVLFLCPND